MKRADIIDCIKQLVPSGYPEPKSPHTLSYLKKLTAELIQAYQAEGSLKEDPFSDVYGRTIYLYKTQIEEILKNKVVLVTGGKGCIGSHLIQKLIQFGVKRIISVDTFADNKDCNTHLNLITSYTIDVRTYEELERVFQKERPDIVFHLAAQRLPWLGEIKIRETITTNFLSTENIITLCEKYRIEKCIFSSTGKASTYITNQVYCCTKKLSEWLFTQATQEGNVTYGAVRFTHVIDNSSVSQQIDEKIENNQVIKIHNPNRYVIGQNADEATNLLLNALVFARPNQLKILTVSNLGWPVETLEIALYKLVKAGKVLPMYFQGCQPGYEEPFFRGAIDWDHPQQIISLINALETPSRIVDDSGDMYIFDATPFSLYTLINSTSNLKNLLADPNVPQIILKNTLAKIIKDLTYSTLLQTPSHRLLKILRWGINPRQTDCDEISLVFYRDILDLFAQALNEQMDTKIVNHFPDEIVLQQSQELLSSPPSMHSNNSRDTQNVNAFIG